MLERNVFPGDCLWYGFSSIPPPEFSISPGDLAVSDDLYLVRQTQMLNPFKVPATYSIYIALFSRSTSQRNRLLFFPFF